MRRGRRESDMPNLEKFLAVYNLQKQGIITQEEASRLFGISIYLWRKWVERYGNITIN